MEVSPMARMTFDRRQAIAASTAGICGLAGGAHGAWAQAATHGAERTGSNRPAALIPRRLLFADPGKSAVRISPDGRRIAYLAPLGGVLNLWVASLDDVGNARALTQATDRSL